MKLRRETSGATRRDLRARHDLALGRLRPASGQRLPPSIGRRQRLRGRCVTASRLRSSRSRSSPGSSLRLCSVAAAATTRWGALPPRTRTAPCRVRGRAVPTIVRITKTEMKPENCAIMWSRRLLAMPVRHSAIASRIGSPIMSPTGIICSTSNRGQVHVQVYRRQAQQVGAQDLLGPAGRGSRTRARRSRSGAHASCATKSSADGQALPVSRS